MFYLALLYNTLVVLSLFKHKMILDEGEWEQQDGGGACPSSNRQ